MNRMIRLDPCAARVVLMLMFNWQDATCIDEWTMAASSRAMDATPMLAGGGAFSLNNALLRHRAALARRAWFRWMGGALPLRCRTAASAPWRWQPTRR
jgi:thiosulfate dehydrogenase [quinone] large subunit